MGHGFVNDLDTIFRLPIAYVVVVLRASMCGRDHIVKGQIIDIYSVPFNLGCCSRPCGTFRFNYAFCNLMKTISEYGGSGWSIGALTIFTVRGSASLIFFFRPLAPSPLRSASRSSKFVRTAFRTLPVQVLSSVTPNHLVAAELSAT